MSEMERERPGDNSGGIKLDLSVNLPTILTMASMLVAAVLYVNNRFADLSNLLG
ncbi:putative endolysin 2 [Salmonella phage vB_SentM_sal2]|nr:putative endolysin 2 [Salmonella phage vB_SentM_sal2]